jgi:Type I phosphodiesterase / nucleotide pyrophosphatase
MKIFFRINRFLVPLLVLSVATQFRALADDQSEGRFQRVLLISVDGLHAVDLANYVKNHPASTLAQLSAHGTTYSNASTPKPSDSFPGVLALVTGGTPVSTGIWYDDAFDRRLAPPKNNSQAPLSGSCTPGVFPGTEVRLDETVDVDLTKLNGGATGTTNLSAINPDALPRDPANNCAPVYPHSMLRVNTIFEVIKKAGLRTAWCDKHPSYDLVNGPSGTGVDDLFSPEINSNYPGGDGTTTVANAEANDDVKVQAILKEIDGFDHTGTVKAGVPAIFGMNFQEVSVGQKVVTGGYTDALGTPSADLLNALNHTDQSLGKMVQELKDKGMFNSTLIIITAKHGQSPIDRNKLRTTSAPPTINPLNTIKRPSNLLADADFVQEDDIALVWHENPAATALDLGILESNVDAAAIQYILAGDPLKLVFNDPALDSRTPDIIVQPELGVIYTGSTKKIAEHGGFSENDTHVALLVAAPQGPAQLIKSPVETMQVAPTILSALGLNPQSLQAVQMEKTAVLPGLSFPQD